MATVASIRGSVPGRCSLWTTSPSTTTSAPDAVCTPRRISAAAAAARAVTPMRFQALMVTAIAMSWASSRSENTAAARAYTSSGTWPSVRSVIASVSASAARSCSVNRSPASSHAESSVELLLGSIAVLAGVDGVHVQAERAVVDLRGADLDQLAELRVDVLGRAALSPIIAS